jgi:CRP/FNR family transcriptional regulator, cyclic AMP receptor protein
MHMATTLETFAVDSQAREYPAGATIFQAFDMGSEMYIVQEGQVELTVGPTVVETVGPGEPFGEMALIDQAPRVATATAKTACKLAVIGERQFLFMVQTTPQFALRMMKVMADRLRKMNARV